MRHRYEETRRVVSVFLELTYCFLSFRELTGPTRSPPFLSLYFPRDHSELGITREYVGRWNGRKPRELVRLDRVKFREIAVART